MSKSDHERPLNDRGIRDAPRMAHWLAENGLIPDVILSSTSQRTRETVGLMQSEWPSESEVFFTESLYLGTPEAMLRAVRGDGCDAERLMILAHNPGVSHFVSQFASQTMSMPTAAIAVFEVELNDWNGLCENTPASLVHDMRPKAL